VSEFLGHVPSSRAHGAAAGRAPAAAGGARGVRGSVLGLQALAGNRAVTRLLARSEDDDDYPHPPLPPPRPHGEIVRDLERVGREINEVARIGNDTLLRGARRRSGIRSS
jgi:hypothetical protein